MKLRIFLLDRNTQWEIMRATEVQTETMNIEDVHYKLIDLDSWEVYQYIVENLRDGKLLYLPKYLDSNISINNIIVADAEDELQLTKRTNIIKIKDFIFNSRLSKDLIFNIYRFIILNDWMISKGYNITDDNREEKYLEIITAVSEMEDEVESEKIISKLEQYLDLKDKLSTNEAIVATMDNTVEQINNASTIDEVNTIYDTYMSQFV